MAKITYTDKVNTKPTGANPETKWSDDDANEVKQSVNDLYDDVGAGTLSDNLIVFSVNSTGDLADLYAGITDAATDKRYSIELRPGVYTTKPIIVKPYIYLTGNDEGACIINPDTVNDTIFTLDGDSSIIGITVDGATSGKAFLINKAGNVNIDNVLIRDCDVGIEQTHASSVAIIKNIVLDTDSSTFSKGIYVTAGNHDINNVKVLNSSTITDLIHITGVNSISTIVNVLSFSPNLTCGLKIEDQSRNNIFDISIVGVYDGIIQSGGSNITGNNIKVFNAQQDGYRCDAGAGGTSEVTFSGVVVSGTRFDINVTTPNLRAIGTVQAITSNSYFDPNADITAQILDLFAGDEANKFISEVHVGSSSRPRESVFGAGDSHTFEYVYTESSANVFTDKTAEAISNTGSTLTFDGVDANSAIYIGNLFPITFEGIKIAIGTAATMGAGEIIVEYWNGAWTEVNGCTSLADSAYFKYAKEYFERTGNYHIKFNPFMTDDWVVNDPITPSIGTDMYWMRFRIVTAVTVAPVIEQIKIHTNRAEFNIDGSYESHMDARTYKKLVVDAVKPIEGSMQNADIYVDENVGVGLENNRFTTVGDILGVSFELPEDCDTSAPIIFVWKGKFAAAGTVNFTVRRNIVKPGDAYTNSEPGASGNTLTVLTGSQVIAAGDTREDFRVNLDISEAIPSRSGGFGDEIWITLQYTTRGTAGNFDYAKLSANYLSDFNGRHIRQ